jgi:RNA polymerase sigma-70 factor, ECF subfamily
MSEVSQAPVERLSQFQELRPLLFSLAYRMLGTRSDAEDVLQESYVRWQSAPAEEIRSPKSYLTTIVARLSLDALKIAHRKREVYVGPWLPEPLVNPDASAPIEMAESLSIAFLHLLEVLSPAERAAFLLHEVFDAGYGEIAAALDTSEANSRQLVSRARIHLRERRPRFVVDRERHQAVLHRFLAACSNGDTTELLTVLKQDVTVYSDGGGKARAALNPIYGADKTVRFILGLNRKWGDEFSGGYPAVVNGEPGFVFTVDGKPASILTLDIDDDERIRAIYYVANPDKLELGS